MAYINICWKKLPNDDNSNHIKSQQCYLSIIYVIVVFINIFELAFLYFQFLFSF